MKRLALAAIAATSLAAAASAATFTGELYACYWDADDDCGLWQVLPSLENSDFWIEDFVEVNGKKEPARWGSDEFAYPVTITPGETFSAEIVHETSTSAHFMSVRVLSDAQMCNRYRKTDGEDEYWINCLWPNGATDDTRAWVLVKLNNVYGGPIYTLDFSKSPIVNDPDAKAFYNAADGDGKPSSTWTATTYAAAFGVDFSGTTWLTQSVAFDVKITETGKTFGRRVWNVCDPFVFGGYWDKLDEIDEKGGDESLIESVGLYFVTADMVSEAESGDPADLKPLSGDVAAQYCGYTHDADFLPTGTISVKVGKASKGKCKVTATVIRADTAKKLSFKGEATPTEKDCFATLRCAGQPDMTLNFSEIDFGGTWGNEAVEGSFNFFASKKPGDAEKAATASLWTGSPLSIAWQGDSGWNTLSLTFGAKGKVKVAGTLANGTKMNASAQLALTDKWFFIPVAFNKKANVAFVLWLYADGKKGILDGLGTDAKVGKTKRGLAAGSKVAIDADAISAIIGSSALAAYYPNGVEVTQAGAKWSVAKGGKVAYQKGTSQVDEAKAGANPSGLKLTYNAKNGMFKGSFKAYAPFNGKPKGFSFKVTGVLVGDAAYGTATMKKASCPFCITR